MPHAAPVTPVVLGHGITALGVLRSLGRAGLEPRLVCPPRDISTASRWARGNRVDIPETDDPDELTRALPRAGIEEAVLFGCSDLWAQAVARLDDEARGRYRSSCPAAGTLDLLVDKVRFAGALTELGVPHPTTRLVEREADLDGLDGRGLWFLKPGHSQRFSRVSGTKGIFVHGPEDARAAYRRMTATGVEALLQEYVPGPPTCHVFVDGFVDAHGVVRALFARRRLRMEPPDFGNSSLMVTVSLESVGDAVDALRALLSGIGYRGIFSAEFKHDARDGEHKLLEVNARPWWYIGFAAHCGVDVSLLAYEDALGRPVETVASYPVGVRCVLLSQDMRAFLRERRESSLGAAAWLRSVAGATSSVFTWSDPLPGLVLPLLTARRKVRRARAGASTRRSRRA
jgi:predicted ATP-grasp superfamily ATP-dependent carboligase